MGERLPNYENLDTFVSPSDEILNQVAEAIDPTEIDSPELQSIINRMLRLAHGVPGDPKYPTLVGLAAPQIGISKQIVVLSVTEFFPGEQPDLQAFINPKITEVSDVKIDSREGCFSTDKVCGIVDRAKSVKLQALTPAGEQVILDLEGSPSRVAQHEIDHLNGVRFPDLITDRSKLHWVEPEKYGEYRDEWQDWPIKCPRSRWESIKNGTDLSPIII